MRVFFRNYPEIDRKRFTNKELYERSVKKQNQEIAAYKKKMKKIFLFSGLSICLILLMVLINSFNGFITNLFKSEPDFTVEKTVMNKRGVSLDKVKIYQKNDIAISEEIIICIDPGHGGEDLGETLSDEEGNIIRSEKVDNMKLANLLKENLENFGFKVILTRTGDTKHKNSDRSTLANENDVDLFISLHRNNLPSDNSKKGTEIYVPVKSDEYSESSYIAADNILQFLEASGISENGGVHYGSITSEYYDFQMNSETDMPSLLIELGYISNEEDNTLYDLNIERYAMAISYGILKTYSPDSIEFSQKAYGEIIKNELITDYSNLSEEEIHYSVNINGKKSYNDYIYEISKYEELYNQYSVEFLKLNDSNEVYLTFDVGNDAGNVKEIVEILGQNSTKAVFFVNYTFAVNHPDLMKLLIDNGHIIGNGTKDFIFEGLTSLEEAEQITQIIDLHEYVLYNYNYRMSLFRFPNGIFSEKLLTVVNNYQYKSVFWSYSYNDYTSLGFKESDVLKSMESSLSNGIIYIMRTDSDIDLAVLDDFLIKVKENGYSVGELRYSE